MVGLLIAQAVLNRDGGSAIYLCANNQLVDQTVAKAEAFNLPVVRYEAGAGRPIPSFFANGQATLIATYRALFHGYSKFKIKGSGSPVSANIIICDDAHTAFADVRNAFSVTITRQHSETIYKALASRLRDSARKVGRQGSCDLMTGGQDHGVFEVPYWSWREVADDIRDLLIKFAPKSEFQFQMPLVADAFDHAHVLVRASDVMITPFLPPVDLIPTFSECKHRMFMSATIADDSSLIRTFDISKDAVQSPIAPASLAGVGERLIQSPALTPVGAKSELSVSKKLITDLAAAKVGRIVLAPSESQAQKRWGGTAVVVTGDAVAPVVEALNDRTSGDNGPYVLVNRYEGVDLAQDACRLLVLDGLPLGSSAYDEFRSNTLRGNSQIELSIAQRVEQGIGRGTRGAGDYCVVVLLGNAQEWVAKRANAALMTPATRAQLDLGIEVSEKVVDAADFRKTVDLCLKRNPAWVQLHARELAERTDAAEIVSSTVLQAVSDAAAERRYFARYRRNQFQQAREIAEKAASEHSTDRLYRGWLLQMAARAEFDELDGQWRSGADLQTEASNANVALFSPPGTKVQRVLTELRPQATRLAELVDGYRQKEGYLAALERALLPLTGTVSAPEFEEGIRALGEHLGLSSDRVDRGGGAGSDNVWRNEDGRAVIISCKNEKRAEAPLHKKDLAQLLIDAKWMEEQHPELVQTLLIVHHTVQADPDLPTSDVSVLTTMALSALVGATKVMAGELARADVELSERKQLASKLLVKYDLTIELICDKFFKPFLRNAPKK